LNIPAERIRVALGDYVRAQKGLDTSEPILETILIRDGAYCGRRFRLADYSLVLFAEENQVKLFNPSGSLRECWLVETGRMSMDLPLA
jgi:hypothetical protein